VPHGAHFLTAQGRVHWGPLRARQRDFQPPPPLADRRWCAALSLRGRTRRRCWSGRA